MQYLHLQDTFQLIPFLQPNLDTIEFGCYTGKRTKELVAAFNRCQKPIRKSFTVDACEGLPPEDPAVPPSPEWPPGVFNAKEYYNVTTNEELKAVYKEMWKDLCPIPELIIAWYKDLSADTIKQYDMGPASYCYLDMDLYGACKEALDFLFKYKLVVPGTILNYDDWNSSPGPEYSCGESRAHLEKTIEYGVQCRRLAMNVFVVERI